MEPFSFPMFYLSTRKQEHLPDKPNQVWDITSIIGGLVMS